MVYLPKEYKNLFASPVKKKKNIINKTIMIENIPTECKISTNKSFIFNMNKYRNAHYRDLNKAKIYMHDWIKSLGIDHKFTKPIRIEYSISCRKGSDFMNIGSVVDKFLQDSLVHCGIIKDDNTKYVHEAVFKFVGNGNRKVDVLLMVNKNNR